MEKYTLKDVPDAVRTRLDDALTELVAQANGSPYPELSVVIRSALQTVMRRLEKEEEGDKTDARNRMYDVTRFQIFDVTAGEDRGDLEATFPDAVAVPSLEATLEGVAWYAGQFHGGHTPPECSVDVLKGRLGSIRSMMSARGGRCALRVRYEMGDAKYLLYVEIARHTPHTEASLFSDTPHAETTPDMFDPAP